MQLHVTPELYVATDGHSKVNLHSKMLLHPGNGYQQRNLTRTKCLLILNKFILNHSKKKKKKHLIKTTRRLMRCKRRAMKLESCCVSWALKCWWEALSDSEELSGQVDSKDSSL